MELVIATGIGGMLLLIVSTLLYSAYHEKERSEFILSLAELRIGFQQALLKTQSWAQTRDRNPSMACFNHGAPSSCLHLNDMAPADLKLYSSAGTLLYDSGNPLSGYTQTGQACSTYGSPGNCNLKPHLKWQVQCNLMVDPNCLSPLVVLSLDYTYTGTRLGSINFGAYGFRIAKATFPLQVTKPCGGIVPSCSASQIAICEPGVWVCREFGL